MLTGTQLLIVLTALEYSKAALLFRVLAFSREGRIPQESRGPALSICPDDQWDINEAQGNVDGV